MSNDQEEGCSTFHVFPSFHFYPSNIIMIIFSNKSYATQSPQFIFKYLCIKHLHGQGQRRTLPYNEKSVKHRLVQHLDAYPNWPLIHKTRVTSLKNFCHSLIP